MAASLKRLMKKPVSVYGLIALTVMLPLLTPGHILTLDMAFTPDLPMPELDSSSFLFRFLLFILNAIFPTHVIEKFLFFAILLLSATGMHRLAIQTRQTNMSDIVTVWGIYIAGVLYMINPFTYSRFMAGQYSVLLGYALMPFFVSALISFLDKPERRTILPLMLFALAISIVSIHSLGTAAIFSAAALFANFWRNRHSPVRIKTRMKYLLFALVTFVIFSSYWLVPLLAGSSQAGKAAYGYTANDHVAYATIGGSVAEKVSNVIRLQGFWAEAHDLYLLPQDILPAWGLVSIFVWVVVAYGVWYLLKHKSRYEVSVFGTSGVIFIILATTGIGSFTADLLPVLGGFREPHKFIGGLALVFAYFAAPGIPAVFNALHKKGKIAAISGLAYMLMLPVLWTPAMFWGFYGQLQPRQYPEGWHKVNERLSSDQDDFKVLFLPWHLYMHFTFAGRVIVNPAEPYFDKPVIVSNDPELAGSSPAGNDPLKSKISRQILPGASRDSELASKLAEENIKYVLLAKETDYESYSYIQKNPGWQLVSTSASMELYLNKAWGQSR